MKKGVSSTVRNKILAVMIVIIIIGIFMLIFLKGIPVLILGFAVLLSGLTGLLAACHKSRFLPIPLKIKKIILMNMMLNLFLFLSGLLKLSKEKLMQYFLELNNYMYIKSGDVALVLLPKCIQNSKCIQDIATDVYNCKKCGNCQIGEILELCKPKKIEVVLVGGGRLAIEKVKEINPDNIVAIACEVELIDGIRTIYHKPVWAINNLRPNGPCINTGVNMEEFQNILNSCL